MAVRLELHINSAFAAPAGEQPTAIPYITTRSLSSLYSVSCYYIILDASSQCQWKSTARSCPSPKSTKRAMSRRVKGSASEKQKESIEGASPAKKYRSKNKERSPPPAQTRPPGPTPSAETSPFLRTALYALHPHCPNRPKPTHPSSLCRAPLTANPNILPSLPRRRNLLLQPALLIQSRHRHLRHRRSPKSFRAVN